MTDIPSARASGDGLCGSCKNFWLNTASTSAGTCHANAPRGVVIAAPIGEDVLAHALTVWPPVNINLGCGEWTRR